MSRISCRRVCRVVGEQEEMEVGFVREEVAGGDVAQGIVALKLPDEPFDPDPIV